MRDSTNRMNCAGNGLFGRRGGTVRFAGGWTLKSSVPCFNLTRFRQTVAVRFSNRCELIQLRKNVAGRGGHRSIDFAILRMETRELGGSSNLRNGIRMKFKPSIFWATALAIGLFGGAARVSAQGACCLFDGCIPADDESQCSGFNGVFLPGEDCADDACEEGACCTDVSCNQANAFQCIIAGRDFAGAGTSCLDDPCEGGVGACCVEEDCSETTLEGCDSLGGSWNGAGVFCSAFPCSPGAC
ncbi:MAG: hypothetical protein IH849_00685 [Acidobacteria bacterium]|nr:hypothetical protein [Acidobacteriota bacterium]